MKNHIVSILLLAAVLLLVISGADSCNKSLFVTGVDTFFSKEVGKHEPGCAVLIMKNDDVVFSAGYGLADLRTKEPVTTKTLFNLGSISKTFVANAILILAEEGKLSLSDPLSRHFSDFKNKEIANRAQIVHLLTHTSGLPDNRNVDADTAFYLTAKDEENFRPVKNNDTLNFQPGERFEYSNPAFNGLALIIEQVAGMKWQQFVTERIFAPAGMINSRITDGPYPESGVAHAYDWTGQEYVENDYGEFPTFAAAGNGGVWSSVDELMKYELAIRSAKFLEPKWIAESRSIYRPSNWADTAAPSIGYSWFIAADSIPRQVYHTGSQGGFRAFYIVIPEEQILAVCLSNSPRPLRVYQERIFELLRKSGWLN